MSNTLRSKGIQMIGTQRSGSNLLRVMLDQSGDIASPHPAHILVTFVPLLHLYGDLDMVTYRILINDVVDYIEANPVPWEGIQIDRELIFNNSNTYSLFEINRLIYDQVATVRQAKYWCCKSMANVHYATELERHSPDIKYIYLYRDGRDVAVSFKKAIVGEKHIYHLAKQWEEDQAACIELSKKISKDRFFALNYETLIEQPETTIKKLCSFLDIPYTESMMSFHTSHESKATAAAGEMWQNLEKPIMSDNKGKFHKELSPQEIEIFELIAHDVLTELNYPLYTDLNNTALIAHHAVEEYDSENRALKANILLHARQSDLDNRQPQLGILQTIKANAVSEIKISA